MMRGFWIFILFFMFYSLSAQTTSSLFQNRTIYNDYNETVFDSIAVNPNNIRVYFNNGKEFGAHLYRLDPSKATIYFNEIGTDTLQIQYWHFPSYLTQKHTLYNMDRVVPGSEGKKLFQVVPKSQSTFVPFDGLQTDGSISRAITVGNNQNLVTTSTLDLQIVGKLSDNVNLRASIQDNNSPLQNGGYSQKIDEFDQIFMEVYGKDWSIKAGDLFVENRTAEFLNFNKKVQGISTKFTFDNEKNKTTIESAAALVRGQYAKSEFTGQEGNQGPYKLRGSNNELYILIISGSERVFVNGRQLTRGENNDYVIDYNSGEIRFTSLFPITADMRIVVEYQYTERNFTRFLGYGNITHEATKWTISGNVYTETDIKNQPLQQSLNEEQIAILQQAGNNADLMYAPSAYVDTYSENKILYKKIQTAQATYFEFSNNPQDTLYMVSFAYVGENQGDYVLVSTNTVGKIYEYVAPVNQIKQGNYDPLIKLTPPSRLTLFDLAATYKPTERTNISTEWSLSNRDQNLFSPIDDQNNKGWAAYLRGSHEFISKWKWTLHVNGKFIHQNFSPIERLYSIEFDRDWNVLQTNGNQSFITAGFSAQPTEKSHMNYTIERLEYTDAYQGIRQNVSINFQTKKWQIVSHSSYLDATSTLQKTNIFRSTNESKYSWSKYWVGARVAIEDYRIKDKTTKLYDALSQSYWQTDVFAGRGDSAKMNIEVGWIARANDSVYNQKLLPSSQSHAWYVKSQLIKNKQTDLSVYANYRILNYIEQNLPNDHSLNSRIVYNDRFLKDFLQWSTIYETTSGSIAQQEFTYIEVEPGLGTHMWNDYNGNGIQELEEFELAPFPDQAIYVRLMLPNQNYLRTHQNKWTQLVNIGFAKWQNEKNWKRLASKFHLQLSWISERHFIKENGKLTFNPFENDADLLVAMNESLRNSIYFNRGKQYHSTTYSYIKNRTKNVLTFGSLDNNLTTHQLQYSHLIKKIWLSEFSFAYNESQSLSENYDIKNYLIKGYNLNPKISYLFSNNARVQLFYEYSDRKNKQGLESLSQHRLGTQLLFQTEKSFNINGEFSFYQNKFNGNPYSAVAYQLLEGLQPGKNMTWRLMLQRNITKYLDANISYQGRTSETSKTIHTGSIQLRAFF